MGRPREGEALQAHVREGVAKQAFMTLIGAELSEVAPGSCRLAVAYSPDLTQQHGFFHGGVTATLVDNAAGIAGYTLMSDDEQPLSVEFKISFVAPAMGDRLEARARVIKNGRRLKYVQVEAFTLKHGNETLVAIGLATVAATRSVSVRE